jgi:proline racemase
VPSFAYKLDQQIEVDGHGSVNADIAYGGDSFAIVDASALGFEIVPAEAQQLAKLGVKISAAATEQVGFEHPENPDWQHISFCLFAAPVTELDGQNVTRHAVAIRPGKIDRSPTGTGVSARLAVLHSKRKSLSVANRQSSRASRGARGLQAERSSGTTRTILGPKAIGSQIPGRPAVEQQTV